MDKMRQILHKKLKKKEIYMCVCAAKIYIRIEMMSR